MPESKRRLLVGFVKTDAAHAIPMKVQDFINHGGVDVIVQSDRLFSRYIAIYLKDDDVYRALDEVLKKRGFFLLFERMLSNDWAVLKGYRGNTDVEGLFTQVLDFIKVSGYKPLTSNIWRS